MSLDRRSFVTGAGALAVTGAMVVLPKSANACKEHHEFFLHAEGLVVFDPMRPAVVSAYPGGMPPWLIGLLIGRVLDIFTITEINKGMLRAEVWVRRGPNYADAALQAALQGVPLQMQPPVPWPLSGIPISIFVVDIAEIHVKRHVTVTVADGQNAPYEKKTNQFIAIGTIVENPVTSPFGELKNRMFAFSGEFDKPGKNVDMVFTGGFAVGSHSTWNFQVSDASVWGKGYE